MKLPLAGLGGPSTLYRVENGFVNLVAVVGFLILAIGLIPTVLFLGTPGNKQRESIQPKHD